MRDYYKEIGDILGSGSTDYAIIPIGDPEKENAARTTVTTVGSGAGDGLVFTYRDNGVESWAAALSYLLNRQRTPVLESDGSADRLTSPTASFWSPGDGTDDTPYSKVVVITPLSSTGRHIFAKNGNTSNTEHRLISLSSPLAFRELIADDSEGVSANIRAGVDYVVGVRNHLILTYDGRGGADAADGLKLYIDKVDRSGSRVNNGSYTAMEPLSAVVALFSRTNTTGTAVQSPITARMDGGAFGPAYTQQELSAVQVQDLFQIWREGREDTAMPRLTTRRLGGVLVG